MITLSDTMLLAMMFSVMILNDLCWRPVLTAPSPVSELCQIQRNKANNY